MTTGTPGGQGQDPASPAVGVAAKMLPLCTQLGPKLQGVSPDGLSTFTGAVVGATRANVSFARCTTASGSRFFFLTITHRGTPSSAGGAPQKLSDGSTLYVQPQESGDFCARYYPDGWSVGFSAEVEAPNFEPDCHSATAVVHAWLTGS